MRPRVARFKQFPGFERTSHTAIYCAPFIGLFLKNTPLVNNIDDQWFMIFVVHFTENTSHSLSDIARWTCEDHGIESLFIKPFTRKNKGGDDHTRLGTATRFRRKDPGLDTQGVETRGNVCCMLFPVDETENVS